MGITMIRRSRRKNNRSHGDASARARELAMRERLESISGYDFDEDSAKEVEQRIRRMSYGHKVEK
jgi:chorismate mutase